MLPGRVYHSIFHLVNGVICYQGVFITPYFIRILTSLSYNLSFYPQSKSNHRTQFTTAQRDVKEAFRRGQGLTDSPRSDRGHPWSREPLDTSHNKQITSLFCAAEPTAPQIFRVIFSTKIVVITFQYYLI